MIRGFRGATTLEEDTDQEMIVKTKELIRNMIEKNNIKPDHVVHIIFTATPDLHAGFPAKVVREFSGWEHVPVMCMQEIDVESGLKKCIRVMLTAETELKQDEVKHEYLGKAVSLRPDLIK
ncbi:MULTISPECIES: chorismate mutase [Bacillus]|uniref:chorismate mutase n=2 Tax=Bacillus TaxID=1386 RepID=A0A0M4G8C1_9BACI|nr:MULTISPECIES: chorismate mutase [Bacillus]ALC81415.1 chorismate mutase [Bacillus gobiensis]MBP1080447.1 chorismate mutase [Bacillus capparidis]MED1094304.1 chorismate mutase [Bacillus capparidis]